MLDLRGQRREEPLSARAARLSWFRARDRHERSTMFRQLLPSDVVVSVASPEMWSTPLHPLEEPYVRRAVSKRRREFSAGRACAREALKTFGIDDFPVIPTPERFPDWPPGIIGSITHTANYCAAAVCRRGRIISLGIDVEGATELAFDIVPLVLGEHERARLEAIDPSARALQIKILFSAKESIYKAYYPTTRVVLDFHDVDLILLPGTRRFVGRLVNDDAPSLDGKREFHGRYGWKNEHVFTSVVVEEEIR